MMFNKGKQAARLNPYFFGKCSTASLFSYIRGCCRRSLNPYFFGKCSTAIETLGFDKIESRLNPYFFGKCSTAFLIS